MRFSRQEYWSGLPFPSLGDLSDPGIEPVSCTAGRSLPSEIRGKPQTLQTSISNWLGTKVANIKADCFFPRHWLRRIRNISFHSSSSLWPYFPNSHSRKVFMILLSIFALPWPENNKVIVYISQATARDNIPNSNQRWICYDVGHTNWSLQIAPWFSVPRFLWNKLTG